MNYQIWLWMKWNARLALMHGRQLSWIIYHRICIIHIGISSLHKKRPANATKDWLALLHRLCFNQHVSLSSGMYFIHADFWGGGGGRAIGWEMLFCIIPPWATCLGRKQSGEAWGLQTVHSKAISYHPIKK